MTNYRRIYTSGATWFFTVNLAERNNNTLLVDNIDQLRQAFRYVKQRRPFKINAAVVLPEHLHTIWTLPPDDSDYSIRWSLLKAHFSRSLNKDELISASRVSKRERGIWQRRFWAHLITDEHDFNRHIDYIHWNPVKHDWVKQVQDWTHSSFHKYVDRGVYLLDWGGVVESNFEVGE
jgi:putative transposase